MKVRLTNRFKKDYRDLPINIQEGVDKKLRLLMENPRHPSLRIHKIQGSDGLWEFSVTMKYRVLFEIDREYYVLLGVGPHQIVDRL